MKKAFFSLSFAVAIISAFAFNTKPTGVAAFYSKGGSSIDCSLTNQTAQPSCATGNTGLQCTVNVSGNPPAWNQSNCTQALKRPM